MASPSPVPSLLELKKGSNNRCPTPGSKPCPLSCTVRARSLGGVGRSQVDRPALRHRLIGVGDEVGDHLRHERVVGVEVRRVVDFHRDPVGRGRGVEHLDHEGGEVDVPNSRAPARACMRGEVYPDSLAAR